MSATLIRAPRLSLRQSLGLAHGQTVSTYSQHERYPFAKPNLVFLTLESVQGWSVCCRRKKSINWRVGSDGFVPKSVIHSDVTPSFPPAGIRAGRLFCASARLKQWAA